MSDDSQKREDDVMKTYVTTGQLREKEEREARERERQRREEQGIYGNESRSTGCGCVILFALIISPTILTAAFVYFLSV